MNILVVDDDTGVSEILAKFLEESGHVVDTAGNGQEALEFLSRNTYDLVFSDHDMPEVTGLELIKIIKKKYPKTVTILLTGYESIKDFFAKSLGADEYLEKPVDIATIEKVIQKYQGRTK